MYIVVNIHTTDIQFSNLLIRKKKEFNVWDNDIHNHILPHVHTYISLDA